MSGDNAARRRRAAFIFASALAALIAACSGGGGDDGTPGQPTGAPLTAIVVNSELVVGENRFVLGLLNPANEEIIGADVSLRFYPFDAEEEVGDPLDAETVVFEKTYTHVHEDGTVESHGAGESGAYVAHVTFNEAGQWVVEATSTADGTAYDPVTAAFDVLAEARSVAIGAPAPLSETLTVNDVEDVADIDTSDPPIPEMHEMTIAEAVTSGKPTLIVFATPAFCLSRVCGPTKGIVDDLFEQYGDAANFVHVEPYDVPRARSGEGLFPVPATSEWGLTSEPWAFLVDADGNVAAKFEGIATSKELTDALGGLIGA